MASVYSYTFDNLTRLGDDACEIGMRNLENEHFGKYVTTNYFANKCGMKSIIDFATKQPSVFYNGTADGGVGGCKINVSNKLRNEQIQTNGMGGKISLFERPFRTVPYLGRGVYGGGLLESKLQQGMYIQNKKSCNTVTEDSFNDYRFVPMVPSLQNTVQNPSNLVEGVASEGWVRGGVATRDLIRDQDYFKRTM